MTDKAPSRAKPPGGIEHSLALLCLLIALVWHFQAATLHWTSDALPGNEFRQTQTGQSTYFILKDDDYSLAYPTPVLGRPWSIPMEFPLYQWTVALLSESSELSLVESARTVSLGCFYASMIGFWCLLGLIDVPVGRRWWCLIPILLSPVTILYGRAFLIETMALAFSVWFVVAFLQLMRRRTIGWLLATAILGALAGVIKATTLLVAAFPCMVIGMTMLVLSFRRDSSGHRSNDAVKLAAWGGAAALPPLLATWAWTRFADETKVLNPLGQTLTSANLTSFNFGGGLLEDRFSVSHWQSLASQWQLGLLPVPLIVGMILVTLLFAGRFRRPAVLCLTVFFTAQIIFPNLYSIHDYYFVAVAGTFGLGLGLALIGLAERRWGRLPAILLLVTVSAAQINTFSSHYRASILEGSANDDLTEGLNRFTEDEEVIIVAGDDWSSTIPYYAKRRALMLAFGSDKDEAVMQKLFSAFQTDEVAALVLVRDARNNEALVSFAAQHLDFSTEPLLRTDYADVYFTQRVLSELLPADARPGDVGGDPIQVYADTMREQTIATASLSKRQRRLFANMRPQPETFFFEFGPAVLKTPDGMLINAHATTRLTFRPSAQASTMTVEYGMFDSVWQNAHMTTDGVEISLQRISEDGTTETLFTRFLDPRGNEADRGLHRLDLPLQLNPGDQLLLQSTPGPRGDKSFDWFFLRDVLIK